ncbi:aminoglycoside phosphotransferase family protein [Kribbella sp. NPDC005582]|uniref:aminoglycoside phosphotransferase family protein n=1 Tax=Kribbella sp. NPDC005582 TaxID=3156893 RepID=UPI0033A2150C
METFDEFGRVRRSAEVVAYLHGLVKDEAALAELVEPVPELIPWGVSGMYFTGRWAPESVDVLVKVGVSGTQRFWSEVVAERDPGLAPRVFAVGDRLSGVEVGWVVMERLPGGLHDGWGGIEFGLLMDAGVRFQRLARTIVSAPYGELTADAVHEWLVRGQERGAPGPVDVVLERFEEDWRFVNEVCPAEVCHGDLHMGNVLMRTPAPEISPALLIDFEPCQMPWVFDAAYPQVLNSDPARTGWQDMVGQMADCRSAYGLPVCADEDLKRAGAIALGWYALRMWGMLGPTPDSAWRAASVWRQQNETYIEAGAKGG